MVNTLACSNCGALLTHDDQFCRQCGQKVLQPEDRRFGALLGRIFEELTSVNGRLLPTFGRLLFRPGALSKAYRLGQWQRYLAPISVFMLANLVFFLAPSVTDFNLSLEDQQSLQPYSAAIAPWIDARQAASGMTPSEFHTQYSQRVGDVAKTMVILHVPIMALVTFVLFWDRRLLYADHVVTTLHFFAFLMLYFALAPVTLELALDALNVGLDGALPVFQIGLLVPLLYMPPMLRTAMDVGWPRALVSSVGFLLAYLLAQLVYRFAQVVLMVLLI